MVSCPLVGIANGCEKTPAILIYFYLFLLSTTIERKIMKKIAFLNFRIINNT